MPNASKQKKIREGVKDTVFTAYGGWTCTCCGEIRKEFLILSHTLSGGNRQRKSLKINAYGFYCWLKRNDFPDGYHVLCMNCNFARCLGTPCPHELEDRFVVTSSGLLGPKHGAINPVKSASALGRICRFGGNGSIFFPVLLHSFVVSDLVSEEYKLAALIHDMAETAVSDVPSPFKVPELASLEEKIIFNMFDSLKLPRAHLNAIKDADRRALIGEIWVYGTDALKRLYANRDLEAEKLVEKYVEMYPPQECVQSDGAAVVEFISRFQKYKQL